MLLAGALVAVIIGAAFVLMLVVTATERASERQAEHSLQELALVNQLETLVIDMETGVRGFVITRQEPFLEPWQKARVAFPAPAAELMRLTDDPVEDPLARQISTQIASYVTDYSVPLVAAARRNDPSVASVNTTQEGKRRVDELRAGFERYRTIESTVLARRQSRSKNASHRATIAASVGLIGSLALIAVVTFYLVKAIVRPIRRAARMSRHLASGDLTARLPEVSAAEIGSLERSFNTMAGSLEANRDELRFLADEQAALRRSAPPAAGGERPKKIILPGKPRAGGRPIRPGGSLSPLPCCGAG